MKNLNDLKKLLGQNIFHFRNVAGWTQQELAEKSDLESWGYISGIENGQKWPRAEVLSRIAKALGVKVKDLFDEGEDSASKSKPSKSFEKWMERFRFLLKGQDESDIKTIYDFTKKMMEKRK